MAYKTFDMLVSFAGAMKRLTVRAVDIHSAMADVRNSYADPAVLVQYKIID